MGFFSKKTFTCERCGRDYEARLNIGNSLCENCRNEEKAAQKAVSGYVEYGWATGRNYDLDQMKAIARHRDDILERRRNPRGITKAELEEAGNNYKKLSEDEAEDIYARAESSSFDTTMGAAMSHGFFCPTPYAGTIVDAADITAVGYFTDRLEDMAMSESIMCAVFTDDPYIPVFPMLFKGKVGLFAMKSKKGRQGIEFIFSTLCPNLVYPVMELKELRKLVKKEGFAGSMDSASVLDRISSALAESGIFKAKNLPDTLPPESMDMLASAGYLPRAEVNRLLKTDSVFAGAFWQKTAARLGL